MLVNERYRRSPYAPWPDDGSLPDAAILIHCFDDHEHTTARYAPLSHVAGSAAAAAGQDTLVSTSLIFAEQTSYSGTPHAYDSLFGGGCSRGGVIFRPGSSTKILCGNGGDSGGYCHELCPATTVTSSTTAPTCAEPACPKFCSWAAHDVHIYLQRHTNQRARGENTVTEWELGRQQSDFAWTSYNEFLVSAAVWNRSLPRSIEAFVDGEFAATAHADFLRRYGLQARDVPILRISADTASPFAFAKNV